MSWRSGVGRRDEVESEVKLNRKRKVFSILELGGCTDSF